MSEFKVKTELLPSRCEVCHQSDQFDPEKGYCLRCENIIINKQTNLSVIPRNPISKIQLSSKFKLYLAVNMVFISTVSILMVSWSLFSFAIGGIICFILANLYIYLNISLQDIYPRSSENPKISSTTSGDFSLLDQAKLQQYTFEIKALGFTRLGDYKIDYSNQDESFLRIFFHPKYQCFATIYQSFSFDREPLPPAFTISSWMEQDWSLSSIQSQSALYRYLWRLPKRLWINHSTEPAKEILEAHLKLRYSMLEDLAITLLPNITLRDYFDLFLKNNLETQDLYKTQKLLSLIKDQIFFKLSPQKQWLGDYKP